MKKYAEIIDKGECRSTLQSFFIDGVLANKLQWERYNYYPQNGQVGELIRSTNGSIIHEINLRYSKIETLVLKIGEQIYVPITENGIKVISENEYKLKVGSNPLNSGMNQNQKKINSDYDNFESGLKGIHYTPGAYYNAFWSDICKILKDHTDNFTIPMYHRELVHECLMYSLDMCRHFERTAGRISENRKKYIASEVCAVFNRHFKEFSDKDVESIINRVIGIRDFESLSANIDSFYNR